MKKIFFLTIFCFFSFPFLLLAQQDTTYYQQVEVLPEYPGGTPGLIRFLTQNLKYPRKARRKNIEGTVYATFIVEKDGSISHTKIKKGIGGGCNEEVLRLLPLMERWTPAMQKGAPVRVEFTLPVRFKLQD